MEYTLNDVILAFGLTLFAGLSTGIGSTIAFFAKRTNTKFLSLALGFSAGVMIYVSFVEIFFQAKESLVMAWEPSGFMGYRPVVLWGHSADWHHRRLIPSAGTLTRSRWWRLPNCTQRTSGSFAWASSQRWPLPFTTSEVGHLHRGTFNPSLGIAIAVAIYHNIPEDCGISSHCLCHGE